MDTILWQYPNVVDQAFRVERVESQVDFDVLLDQEVPFAVQIVFIVARVVDGAEDAASAGQKVVAVYKKEGKYKEIRSMLKVINVWYRLTNGLSSEQCEYE